MERSITTHVTRPSGPTTKPDLVFAIIGSVGVDNELLKRGLDGGGGIGREEQQEQQEQQHGHQPLAVWAAVAGVPGQNGAGASRKFIAGRNRAKRTSAR